MCKQAAAALWDSGAEPVRSSTEYYAGLVELNYETKRGLWGGRVFNTK